MKPKADYDKLGFVEAVSPGREQRFFDFTVNRRALSAMVGNEGYQPPPEPTGDFPDLRDFYFSRSEYEAALSHFSAGFPMK